MWHIYHLGSYEMIIQESVEKSESGKKEDKRGRLDREVDKKISREIFVQNEKINFGDMHKNIHLLVWV